jgi:hypothetical protein
LKELKSLTAPMEAVSTLEALKIFGDDALPVLQEKLISLEKKLEFEKSLLEAHGGLYKVEFRLTLKYADVPFSQTELIEPLFAILHGRKVEELKRKLETTEREYKRIRFALKSANQWVDTGKIQSLDVEGAKQYPVERLITGEVRGSGKIKHAFCPFHEETNPSFCIYTDTNSYYCFSCKEGGDVIDLCMKLKKIGFREAVEFLS